MEQGELRAAAEAAWHAPDALHPLVGHAAAAGLGQDAVVMARQLLAIDHDRRRATATYADALAAAGRPREAYVVLSDAFTQRGLDGAWARRRMGELLLAMGDAEQGRQQLWVALTMDPNDAQAVEAWVSLYDATSRAAGQAELVRLADQLHSGVAAARLVRAHLRGGDHEGAVERVEQAMAHRDGRGEVVVLLCDVLGAEGRNDVAVSSVAPAVDLATGPARAVLAVARAHAALGRRGEAGRWLAAAEAAADPSLTAQVAALRATVG